MAPVAPHRLGPSASLTGGWRHRARLWVAFGLIYIVYGGDFVAIGSSVHGGIPALLGGGARDALSGGALLLGLAASGRDIRLSPRTAASTAVSGVLLLGGYAFIALASRHVGDGLVSLLVATTPVMLLIMRVAFAHERVPAIVALGSVIGLSGVAAIGIGTSSGGGSLLGLALSLMCAVFTALGVYLAPRMSMPRDTVASASWQMLWAGVAMVVIGLLSGEAGSFHASQVTTSAWVGIAYLLVIGGLAPYVAFIWLLEHVPASQVAASTYVNPVVAVAVGWGIAGQTMSWMDLAGGGFVLVSVVLILRYDNQAVETDSGVASSETVVNLID